VHWFLSKHLAGTEVYTYNLSAELSKRHEVYIYCREDGFLQEEFRETDEVYRGLPIRRVYFNLIGRKAHLVNRSLIRFRNKVIEDSFERFLRQVKPDVVHIQHLFKLSAALIPLAKRKGIPVVVTSHDYWFICHNAQLLRPNLEVCSGPALGFKCAGCAELNLPYWVRTLMWPLVTTLFIYRTMYMKNCLKKADVIIAPSEFLKNKFVEHGFAEDGILVLDNGTNAEFFRNCERRLSENIRFGYIGTIRRHKGMHILIEAFNKIDDPQAELKIFGDPQVAPDYCAEMQGMMRNPRIQFLGKFDNPEIGRILAGIDALVIPSLWPENSPVTIHEAYLAKVPVIASNLGGIPSLVEDGVTGLLFEPGSVDNLVAKITLLIKNRSLLERLRANIGTVKTIKDNARELEEIYRKLIEPGRIR